MPKFTIVCRVADRHHSTVVAEFQLEVSLIGPLAIAVPGWLVLPAETLCPARGQNGGICAYGRPAPRFSTRRREIIADKPPNCECERGGRRNEFDDALVVCCAHLVLYAGRGKS